MKQQKQDPKQQPNSEDKIQGEGDYEAARRYDEKAREYVKTHNVEQAARDAEPRNEGEERDMERAEEQGKRRAKDEDPLLEHPDNVGQQEDGAGGRKRR
jgi:hypothetical protein